MRQEFFTDDVAREYAGRQDVLFVSDIRTANPAKMDNKQVEICVARDQEWQSTWHKLMQPLFSMFKFRLPWDSGTTRYLDGQVFLPVYGPQTTTETRLVVTRDAEEKDWDNTRYQDQMFYFNTTSRQACYARRGVVDTVEGLDNCFDCTSELYVLYRYLLCHHNPKRSELPPLTGGQMAEVCILSHTHTLSPAFSVSFFLISFSLISC